MLLGVSILHHRDCHVGLQALIRGAVATILNLTMTLSLAGFVIHLLFGSPWAAATHFVIGTVAAVLRGMCK